MHVNPDRVEALKGAHEKLHENINVPPLHQPIVQSRSYWSDLACAIRSFSFAEHFLYNVAIRNIVGQLLVIPYLLILMLGIDNEYEEIRASYFLAFLQWLVLGYLIARLVCRKK